jgi:hypothetical protein
MREQRRFGCRSTTAKKPELTENEVATLLEVASIIRALKKWEHAGPSRVPFVVQVRRCLFIGSACSLSIRRPNAPPRVSRGRGLVLSVQRTACGPKRTSDYYSAIAGLSAVLGSNGPTDGKHFHSPG